jgi:DNA-binding response OmpR family regulator
MPLAVCSTNFWNPIVRSTGVGILSVRARRPPQQLRKLLVIDDDSRLLASYRDLLSPYGFHVFTAEDGQMAIPIVEENPDILLVILDLAMPRMDGREWLRWFRDARRESPVIVISGHKPEGLEQELRPSVILEKPFHVAELLDLVGLFCGLGTPASLD